MDELARAWEQLTGRLSGPMMFRLVLQPAMALALAIRAGLADARAGRPPYLWTMLTDRRARGGLFRGTWRDVGRVFVLACAIDAIYQLLVFQRFYPLQMLIVAYLLAFVPYALVRGLVTRFAKRATATTQAPS